MRSLSASFPAVLLLALFTAAPARASAPGGTWALVAPPVARSGHTAVVDPARDELVVFGGRTSTGQYLDEVLVQNLDGPPRWARLSTTGSAPAARYGHAAVADPSRDRMLVFGGFDGTSLGDVRALSLGPNPTWSLITPAGTAPAARRFHTMVLDPLRDRLLVFGGLAGTTNRNDVWALSLGASPEWTQILPTGTPPSARRGACAAYDPVNDRMLVFGGSDASGYRNDVWSLSLNGTPAWSLVSTGGTPPPTRTYAGAVFDATGNQFVVFGGMGENAAEPGAWALALAGTPTWAPIPPAGAVPAARGLAPLAFDTAHRRIVSCGGSDGVATFGDVWMLGLDTGSAWVARVANWTPPAGLRGASGVYDPVRDRVLVFGGGTTTTCCTNELNTVKALVAEPVPTWTTLAPTGTPPTGRSNCSVVYDAARDRLIVYGGHMSPYATDDLWQLSLPGTPSWTYLGRTGAPSMRDGHVAVLDAARDRMIVFGGSSYAGMLNDELWSLDLSGVTGWTRLTPVGTPPPPTSYASAILDPARDRMLLFGGWIGGTYSNQLYALSLSDPPTWTLLSPTGTVPSARSGHSAAYDAENDRMLVFGGGAWPSIEYDNVTWALSLAGGTAWSALATDGDLPLPRSGHAAAIDPLHARLFVVGGTIQPDAYYTNETRVLSWAPTVDAPPAARPIADAITRVAPNPARGEVSIELSLARAGDASVRVLDVSGRLVRTLATGSRVAGTHMLQWNGRTASGARVAPGLYFCELVTGAGRAMRRVVLVQ